MDCYPSPLIVSPLIYGTGFNVHTTLPIFINILLGDFTPEPDYIRMIDKLAIFSIVTLYPTIIAHPVGQKMNQPALPLCSHIIRIRQASIIGRCLIVMNTIDRLQGMSRGVAERPSRVPFIELKGGAVG
jgi:hypothetical protein